MNHDVNRCIIDNTFTRTIKFTSKVENLVLESNDKKPSCLKTDVCLKIWSFGPVSEKIAHQTFGTERFMSMWQDIE